MDPERSRSTAATVAVWVLAALPVASNAAGAELATHQAVYDMKLIRKSSDLIDGSGRIALELDRKTCDRTDLHYRYVAKFVREDETVVTDQQTESVEDSGARTYEFTTKAFVDNALESVIRGKATSTDGGTTVEIVEPQQETFRLPLSVFPSAHTAELVEKAIAGERLVETRFYDGDNEAGKMLTTTAIVLSAKEETTSSGATRPADQLKGLRRWRVLESFFNLGEDVPEGVPLFRSNYTLYENGVFDDLEIDNGDYAFAGTLSKLDVSAAPSCPRRRSDIMPAPAKSP